MARLIDADALMKYIRNHDYQLVSRMGCVDKGMFTDGIEHGINIQPTVDAAEVVRCKDCKHFVQGEPYDPCECMKWKIKFGVAYTTPEGYCHKAEREDNA